MPALWLTALGATAQSPASISLPAGIPLKRIGYAPLPGVGRHLLLTVGQPGGHPRCTPLLVQVYDSTLHLLGQHSAQLRGKCTLIETNPIKGQYSAAFQFRQHNTWADSTFLLAFDAGGRPTGVLASRQHITGRNRATPLNLPTADLLVKSAGSTRRQFTVQSLRPSLQPCWEQSFVAPRGAARLNAYAADSTHLWLLLTEHANSRRNNPVAVCLDLATGRQLSRTPLTTGSGLREVSTCTIGPNHSLSIVGHAFAGTRPKNSRMGELFLLRLQPDGRVLTDHQVAVDQLPARHKVIWRQVANSPNGGLRVIGETYTRTSFGGMVAFYAVSWAATFTYAAQQEVTLRPRDLLLLDFNSAGQLQQRQLVALPKGGSFYKGRYLAARRLAREAAERGRFRYRATAPGNVTLLRTKQGLLAVRANGQAAVPLRAQADHCVQDIVGTSGHQVLVTEFNKKKKQFSLLQVPFN
ncbi:hypothetical protein ACFST9_13180 [Hymenobacter monticola]